MVAIRKDLVAVEYPLSAGKEGEIVSLENSPSLYYHVCAYYRPNKGTVAALDNLELALEEIQTELNKNPRAGLFIVGDFNATGINSNNLTVQPEAYNKDMCQRLMDLFGSFELTS